MLITRRSQISGEVHMLEVGCSPEQLAAWEAGVKIQDAMPDVPASLREFLMTGITPREWEDMFGKSPRVPRRKRA